MPWAGPATATMPAPLTGGRSRVTVSATLAANEALATRRLGGQQVLPLGFGEAGLPVHPALRAALTAATARSGYGPVAGIPALRAAAAGYWDRRELPTDPDQTAAGPGSKPLLFALLLAIGTDVAVPQPSWVSYAAHASLAGRQHASSRPRRAASATPPSSTAPSRRRPRAAARSAPWWSPCRTTRPAGWPARPSSASSARWPTGTT